MARIRTAFVSGTTLNNPLAIGDVTLSSAALSSLAAVTAPDYALLVLDPAGVNGTPEVVTVTAHTAAATTATITRSSEGSTARAHPVGTSWVHGATTYDFLQGPQIVGSNSAEQTMTATSPADLVTISNLNIPVTSGIVITGNYRKTTGGANACGLGLKINSTTVVEANSTSGIAITAGLNLADNGFFRVEAAPRSANYLMPGVAFFGTNILTAPQFQAGNLASAASWPNVAITSITIRGVSGVGPITLAVKDVVVIETKYALGL